MRSLSTVCRPAVSTTTRSALVAQMTCELRGGGGLSGAVQADQHDHHRRRARELEPSRIAAERAHELAMYEADEVLLRREAPQYGFAECVLLHAFDELAYHADVDVGFQQRQAHVAERVLDVALGDLPLSPELAP